MAVIDFKVFAGGSKKCLQIGNEEYVRPISSLAWTRLRIGVLSAFVPDGTNNLVNCSLIVGMCSDYSGFSLVNATNAFGAALGQATTFATNTYTYNAGAGNPYYACGSGGVSFRKVSGVVTASGAFGAGGPYMPTTTGSIQRAVPMYFDLVKGSPNYTVNFRYMDTTSFVQVNYTLGQFYDGFEQGTGTVVLNGNSMSGQTMSQAFSESTYPLTSAFVYWQKSVSPLQIYAIGVARLA